MVLRMPQQLLKDKYREFNPRKKDRRLSFFLFILTILISLVLWAKSGDLNFEMPSISLPLFFPKTYVFEKEKPSRESLEAKILKVLGDKKGSYGFWFKNLKTQESFGVKENQEFRAASVNKVPIMMAFYQAVEEGALRENQVYKLKAEDKQEGAGSMVGAAPGTEYSYKELVRLCGIESDNTAAHVLLNITGFKRVQKILEEADLEKTLMEENLTTPFEAGRLFELAYKGKILKKENQEKFFDFLTDTFFEERIPAGVPQEIRVAHKVGTNVGIYNDCGIVFAREPYVLCILSDTVIEEEAKEVLPEISRLAWESISL